MCGIVGHVGPLTESGSDRSLTVLLDGLSRLEYRGYDSAGVALVGDEEIDTVKAAGKLEGLRTALKETPPCLATAGIGHTRWATHGGPTTANAHPHCAGRLAVVHNGIIENFRPLREEVEAAGRELLSDTDTEVVAHVLDMDYSERLALAGEGADAASILVASMRAVSARLEGTFALLAVSQDAPGAIVAARRSSPLVIGLGEGENFLGSDVAAFVAFTKRAAEVGDDQVLLLTNDEVRVWDSEGRAVEPATWEVSWDASAAVKGGYDTFMDKEIHDQPTAVADTLRGRFDERGELQLDEMRVDPAVLRSVDKIIVVACGTASYAGHVAKYAIEHWCRVPVEVELAHEFRYRDPVVSEKTLTVAISQSGETMDTIQAIRHAREQGSKVLAIVNTYGSTIARESDAVLYTHAGPEVAVASTKAFLAQITACYLLGLYLAQLRGTKWADEVIDYLDKLGRMPESIQRILDEQEQSIKDLGQELASQSSFLFLGRHVGFPVALEGALKLKELAYVHAEGFAAGELKHGPIALVEEGLPVFVIVPTPRRPMLHGKVISNIQEIRARGARTIVIAEEGDTAVEPFADHIIRVPATPTLMMPLLTVVPLQIFAAALATAKGLDVDQPRNLAKSVTVE
ncbi:MULTISPECIES: glutamine--fructose-6-phosphate transaminase (isomerizing) [Actinomyces]|uniref:Glutamine--fructose-6-phosphate aminotransferase [isomerizing] n=2 Tax=Actinomyces TaxID=1654 RepID=A0A853EKT0_9ACTO|nr:MULTISPECIES: glutamine--fructose-6-phosphate transaminase (isomerizing) [Actinomyces]MBF0696957.1 glutamine--fructose-6-phosphate transaminase (isomerizing) [Actinomyces bowdenii]MCR2053439.1 glutamine--fructose-6-phosphate transaminase (isomerizing) [Actinomyces bowdenii]MDO5064983.1 glutamine--fructose-6-phosphate transaminase (isomerizing) [Actinomyces bowdenii]NYS69130.1 glutamine--fructose-6-phosphate transaminase (isomerizing) [Actinomyces bowdenii]BDA64871.1 glutamine--fructose-6-ph